MSRNEDRCAFHGRSELKAAVIARLSAFASEGILEPGHHGPGSESMLQRVLWNDLSPARKHSLEEVAGSLGVPEWFIGAYVLIFDMLSRAEAAEWAVKLMQAIPVGADLSSLGSRLQIALLDDKEIGIAEAVRDCPSARVYFEEGADLARKLHTESGETDDPAYDDFNNRLEVFLSTLKDRRHGYRPRWALLCLAWIMSDMPASALLYSASARIGALNFWERQRHYRETGGVDLVPAAYLGFGSTGLARLSDWHQAFGKAAAWLLAAVAAHAPNPQAARSGRVYTAINFFEPPAIPAGPHGVDAPPASRKPSDEPISALFEKRSIARSRHARTLALAGLFAVLCGVTCVGALSALGLIFWGVRGGGSEFWYWPLGVGAAGLALTLWLFRTCLRNVRRYSSGYGPFVASENDGEFILYLRCFAQDETIQEPPRSLGPTLWGILPERRAEEDMVAALAPLGPVVAVGFPGDTSQISGAARIQIGNADWQGVVRRLMQSAKLVVFSVGFDMGVRYELEQARRLLRPERILVFVPDFLRSMIVRYRDRRGVQVSYLSFLDSIMETYFSSHIPVIERGQMGSYNFLWLRPGWQARPLWEYTNEPRGDGARYSDYFSALTPLYREHGANPRRNRRRLK